MPPTSHHAALYSPPPPPPPNTQQRLRQQFTTPIVITTSSVQTCVCIAYIQLHILEVFPATKKSLDVTYFKAYQS